MPPQSVTAEGFSPDATTEVKTAPVADPSLIKLFGAGVLSAAVESFYGADNHFLGKPLEDEGVRSIIEKDGKNEVLAEASSPEKAILDTLDVMRNLETVRTKALMYLPMNEGQQVLFSSVENYTPKIAPGSPVYEKPVYLKEHLSALDGPITDEGRKTLANTREVESWGSELIQITQDFLNTPAGLDLTERLKIKNIAHLTPEQAIKLSIALVQSLSKYSYDAEGKPDGSRADGMTAMALLREGMARKEDPEWQGNGVCRNVAANVVSVFDALKQNQTELSMLNNTHVTLDIGESDQVTKTTDRSDDSKNGFLRIGERSGHAWNSFITIDSSGSANVTTVDATWALDKDSSSAEEHMDYTADRLTVLARELAEQSTMPVEVLAELSSHYSNRLREVGKAEGITSGKYQDMQQFAFTEIMQFVRRKPEALALDTVGLVSPQILRAALQIADRLSENEVEVLCKMQEAGWINNLDGIVKNYVEGNSVATRASFQKIERLIHTNSDAQEAIYRVLGQEKSVELSEQNPRFRVKLRTIHPEWLPRFDTETNPADAREMSYLAEQIGIQRETDPKRILKQVRERIFKICGQDQSVYNLAVAGRTEYDLVLNYPAIWAAVSKISADTKG